MTTTATTLAALMSKDDAFAAANRAAAPGIFQALAGEAATRREAFLEALSAVETAARARKTLTDAALEAGIVSAREGSSKHHLYFGGKDHEGVLVVAGASLRCSHFHPTVCDRSGRHEFVFLPLADAALREVQAAADALVATPEEVQRYRAATTALWHAQQGRRANASRQSNAAERASLAIAEGTYAVGEGVEVHAMGRWYEGEVVALGRTGKVTVRYTSGTGTSRDKAVASDKVRKMATAASCGLAAAYARALADVEAADTAYAAARVALAAAAAAADACRLALLDAAAACRLAADASRADG